MARTVDAHGKKNLVYCVTLALYHSNVYLATVEIEERQIAAVLSFPELYNPCIKEGFTFTT